MVGSPCLTNKQHGCCGPSHVIGLYQIQDLSVRSSPEDPWMSYGGGKAAP